MSDRTEINPSTECLEGWREEDFHLGGEGMSLSQDRTIRDVQKQQRERWKTFSLRKRLLLLLMK